jgi:hypothetical protein
MLTLMDRLARIIISKDFCSRSPTATLHTFLDVDDSLVFVTIHTLINFYYCTISTVRRYNPEASSAHDSFPPILRI